MDSGTLATWLPAVAVLACGLVAGVVVLLRLRRERLPKGNIAGRDLDLRDLTEKKEALLQQLRDFDEFEPKKSASQLADDRRALEVEAARVLRSIDKIPAPDTQSLPEGGPSASTGRQSSKAGFFWGVATTAALAALLFFVSQSIRTRENPAAPVTGGAPSSTELPPGVNLETLVSAVQKNPDDLNAHLELAYAYLLQRDMIKAFEQTSFVLQRSPGNARALSYQALVRLAMGDAVQAEAMLKEAIRNEPDLLEAWVHLAIVYAQTGRMKEAEDAIAEGARRHPDQAAALQEVLTELRAAAAQNSASPSVDSSTEKMEPATDGQTITGEIVVEGGRAIPMGAVVFVLAREAGVSSGPPKAVTRLAADHFPLQFMLSSANSMLGQPLPGRVRLEVHVDSDGNPLTKQDSDLTAVVDNLAVPASDVQVVVK